MTRPLSEHQAGVEGIEPSSSGPEPDALPLDYTPMGRCLSRQASLPGGLRGTRTPDLQIKNLLHYHLCYQPKVPIRGRHGNRTRLVRIKSSAHHLGANLP